MRSTVILATLLLGGCGRVGFDERAGADAGDDALPDAAPSGFSRVTAYADQTCALYRDRLHCWGANDAGQLGDGTTTDRARPAEVRVPAAPLIALSLGEQDGCAIVDGAMLCWGARFTETPASIALPGPPRDVALGRDFTCVIAGTTPHCFGANGSGQLGDGTTNPHATPMPISDGSVFVALDGGDDHACGLTDTNTALCWGHNDDGALGTGSMTPTNSLVPVATLPVITTLPMIAGWHACTVQAQRALCWGRNDEGALGDGTTTSTATPQLVPSLDPVASVATGGGPTDLDATCAISNGDVYCFGMGLDGRLGNGTADPSLLPTRVVGLPGPAREVALGYAHSCAALVDGELWCWGRGDRGQLGDGLMTSSFVPVRVVPP